MQGYVHVYTGDGKGKTTSAIGLSMRAAGAGIKVFIAQFVKGMHYSELDSLAKIPQITVKQYGLDCFIYEKPKKADIESARKGFEEVIKILGSDEYGLVILDEANIAIYYELFSEDELIEAIRNRNPSIEVVITGRKATDRIIGLADLVTEMREIKHYYNKGVPARKGIES